MARLVIALLAAMMMIAAPVSAQAPTYAPVTPGAALRFPRDHGAHPDFRTEWWYVTGWLTTEAGEQLGFQVTFFRSRPQVDQANPSAFAPKQVLFAHAALSDPKIGKLLHGQRIARQGFGLAEASTADADVFIDDWRLRRLPNGRFAAKASGEGFSLDLQFHPTQPPIAQGRGGYSRKGPLASQASYYYSVPQLKVSGAVVRRGKALEVTGSAWLDREWSSTLLDPKAVGWDWVGLNLDDGGALMAFQVRDAQGRALWAGGSHRSREGVLTLFSPKDVSFSTQRAWRSPRTGGRYPIEQTITARLPGGERRWLLKPLFDDQELDSRSSGGPVYWEGAVTTSGGRGYLELTGYVSPMSL